MGFFYVVENSLDCLCNSLL